MIASLVKVRHLIEKLKEGGCIKKIIRVKNGFSKLTNDNIEYADIKLNVLIEVNNMRMIGEIQFLLSIFLKSKKKMHSIYSVLRNEDYFKQLYLLNNNFNINKIEFENQLNNQIKRIILTKNMSQFSKLLQDCNQNEMKFIIVNQKNIKQFIQDNQWKKGSELFDSVLKIWN